MVIYEEIIEKCDLCGAVMIPKCLGETISTNNPRGFDYKEINRRQELASRVYPTRKIMVCSKCSYAK